MIRINPTNWTADFRISRALSEAYDAALMDDIVFFCVGDPQHAIGRLGPLVGDETIKYYPNVLGTSDDPVTAETVTAKVDQLRTRYADKYVIGIEAGYGLLSHLGSIEITDRGFTSISALDLGDGYINDVTVNVVLRWRENDGSTDASTDAQRPAGSSPGLAEAAREVGSDEPDPRGGRAGRAAFTPLTPDQIDGYKVQQLTDKVIDGNLRFLSRIGKQRL